MPAFGALPIDRHPLNASFQALQRGCSESLLVDTVQFSRQRVVSKHLAVDLG